MGARILCAQQQEVHFAAGARSEKKCSCLATNTSKIMQSVLGSKPLASVLFFPFLALRVGLLVRKRGEFAGHGAGTAGAALAKKLNGD